MQNFVRYYEFTFFELDKDNKLINNQTFKIANSINFRFNYNITNRAFNTANFFLYNISDSTRELFTTKNKRRGFYFRACYENPANLTQSLIFRGLVYRVNYYREGPDIITEVIASDVFFNLKQANFTASYPKGTIAAEIIQDISKYLGVFNMVSGVSFLNKKDVYNHPISYKNAPIADVISDITSDNSCTWAYDVTGINIYPLPNNPDFNAPLSKNLPLISRKTGLVGNIKAENISAQLFPIDYFAEQQLVNNHPFTTATCLLRPIPLFSKIKLECETKQLNGIYVVYGVTYSGEYRGNPWYTTMKLCPIVSQ